ncbi:dimethyl sulfoxide reductase anchor subunit family protein [Cognatilysobacter lacus]|uniref:Dimethyl sulfoxide reductase anchor subunit n=1 Tax=Cognatilysobacter lacus TaxID=1643323 RepID=A0A5D8Z117_9GAMM|nr:DmsC/YnfH family molybdoenzyme membrane anchor subunit [Lysobacter lacus]TZF88685.1 dimethyl sulfoxide reductase anchor subunit [Lysobacter lacus]
MHPALSVIFFTTLSGLGYGLFAWAGVGALFGASPRVLLAALVLGLASSTAGLICSLGHLGKPLRAWRAFSQWRSSWLSREGVAAVVTYVPAVALGAALLPGMLSANAAGTRVALSPAGMLVAALLIACALATVYCTAMIYASLKPIPAWTHRSVPLIYLLFALMTGAVVMLLLQATLATPVRAALPIAMALVVATALLKRGYWHAIDTTPLPVSRGDAVGLPTREVRVFERPHTEGNFVTREMVFVLARKHATRLRTVALVLVAALPVACMVLALFVPAATTVTLAIAVVSVLGGALVERWLFFAQARHLVSLYY